MIYSHIYPITHEVCVQMILPDYVSVHIQIRIMINSGNNLYEVIWYMHQKMIYYYIVIPVPDGILLSILMC